MFIKSGLLVDKKFNKSVMSSWFAVPDDPQTLKNFELCEAIGTGSFFLKENNLRNFDSSQSNTVQ